MNSQNGRRLFPKYIIDNMLHFESRWTNLWRGAC